MPEIPTFENEIQPHLAATPQASPSAMALPGEALERAGAEVSGEMEQFNARYQQARREADATTRLANTSQQLGDAAFRWGKTPDRQQALTGFNQESLGLKKSLLDGVSDPLEQQILSREFDSQQAMRAIDTGHQAFTLESHKRVGELDTNLATYSQLIAGTQDEAIKAKLSDQATAAIHTSVAAGWLDPEEAAQREIGWKSQVQDVKARQTINAAIASQDPTTATEAARAINDLSQFPGLQPERREILARQVDNLQIRLENRAIARQAHEDAVSERQLHEAQANNETTILAGVYANKPPPSDADLEQLAYGHRISASGLEAIHRAKEQQSEGRDDPMTLAHLTDGIDKHQITSADIYAAMQAPPGKGISGKTGVELLKTINKGEPSANEREALNTLDTVMKDHGQFGSFLRDPTSAAQANLEFHQRVNAGQDPMAVLPDVISKYVPSVKYPIWLPRPSFGTAASPEDLNAVAAATVKAHNSHAMSDQDYDAQVRLLNQYRGFYAARAKVDAILPHRPAAKAAPQTGVQP